MGRKNNENIQRIKYDDYMHLYIISWYINLQGEIDEALENKIK